MKVWTGESQHCCGMVFCHFVHDGLIFYLIELLSHYDQIVIDTGVSPLTLSSPAPILLRLGISSHILKNFSFCSQVSQIPLLFQIPNYFHISCQKQTCLCLFCYCCTSLSVKWPFFYIFNISSSFSVFGISFVIIVFFCFAFFLLLPFEICFHHHQVYEQKILAFPFIFFSKYSHCFFEIVYFPYFRLAFYSSTATINSI